MKMRHMILIILLLTIGFSQSKIEFSKFGNFRWEISLDHMIIYLNSDFDEFQLNTKLKEYNGRVVNKLNNNNYYLIQFRNRSKTEIIYQRQINKIRTIPFIRNMIPVMKFSDKLSNLDIYENSEVGGFSMFKNDSLYIENLNMRANFVSCYNKEFRNQPKFVRYIFTNFQIENGETKNLKILETDMEEDYIGCIRRVIENQAWKNEKFKGRVSFFYIVYTDRR